MLNTVFQDSKIAMAEFDDDETGEKMQRSGQQQKFWESSLEEKNT
jgi:hypothetical protein